ncbi:MAG: polyketide synthase dehydratase domain-containing protein [Desulfobulbaceae bacterium]|nr:polyketide synthase dehydratase domain-containing protein [Desulfobulbaceae bacterium]
MPFNMGLELMADAAAQHFTNKALTAIEKARAHGWLFVEQEKQQIRIVVSPQNSRKARVSLYKTLSPSEEKEQLVLEATLRFADSYPSPPPAPPVHDHGAGKGLLTREEIYPKHMFHGPSFQSIVSLQQCGQDSALALLQKPDSDLFQPWKEERLFFTEPLLLDGAGQLVGLWAANQLKEHFVIFPAAVEQISFFKDSPRNFSSLTCEVNPRLQGDSTILSDINLVSANETVFAQITGLQHRRINMPEIIHRFRGSREVFLSSSWDLPRQHIPATDSVSCCRLQRDLVDLAGSDRNVLLAVIAHIILGRNERRHWYGLKGSPKRREEWLLGRLAGKEAIRRLLLELGKTDIRPADIEIMPDAYGKPLARGNWAADQDKTLSLSLSHSGNTFVALAGVLAPKGSLGIDIEEMRELDEDFINFAFSAEEREIILNDPQKALRCWCAKESAAKALGFGMPGGPRDMIVESCDELTGEVKLKVSGLLEKEHGGDLPCKELLALTSMDDSLTVALTLNVDTTVS